jgi:hypothetical protein
MLFSSWFLDKRTKKAEENTTMLKCPDPECQKPKTKCKYCSQRHRKAGRPTIKHNLEIYYQEANDEATRIIRELYVTGE